MQASRHVVSLALLASVFFVSSVPAASYTLFGTGWLIDTATGRSAFGDRGVAINLVQIFDFEAMADFSQWKTAVNDDSDADKYFWGLASDGIMFTTGWENPIQETRLVGGTGSIAYWSATISLPSLGHAPVVSMSAGPMPLRERRFPNAPKNPAALVLTEGTINYVFRKNDPARNLGGGLSGTMNLPDISSLYGNFGNTVSAAVGR